MIEISSRAIPEKYEGDFPKVNPDNIHAKLEFTGFHRTQCKPVYINNSTQFALEFDSKAITGHTEGITLFIQHVANNLADVDLPKIILELIDNVCDEDKSRIRAYIESQQLKDF